MTEDQRTLLEEGCAQLESRAGLIWGAEFIEEFAAAIRSALAEVAQRTAERDEARRWWCYQFSNARSEAMRRGWDCFKKEGQP
jgi:hypothetical protein